MTQLGRDTGGGTGSDTDTDTSLARVLGLVRDVPDYPSPGILFRDITPVLADAEAFATVATELASLVGAAEVVVGVEARGFLLGAAVALVAGTGVVPGAQGRQAAAGRRVADLRAGVRHRHAGAAGRRPWRPGARVFVVDDVLATGGTAAAACALLLDAGADVVGFGALLELTALGGRRAARPPPGARPAQA